MSECVKETECTNCVHRQVCGFKEDYLKALEKFHDCVCDERFELKFHCKYYEYAQAKTAISMNYDDAGLVIRSNY